MGDTLMSMLRYVCGLVDSVVYILISKLYELFIDTTNIILYSQKAVDAIGKRIGLILGIVMLFSLAISLISYLISPDKISDNAKGGSKIVTNIIVSLIVLVTINPIFEQAYKIQIKLVESKFVEKIFFGPQASIPNVDIAYSLYSSFLTPNPEECKDLLDPYVGLKETCSTQIGAMSNHKITDVFRNDILESHNLYKVLNNYDVINYKINGDYFFNYFMIVSTVAGVVVSLMLITFCMDVATRAIKLLFLQIIAPIPIIANVDPNKGTDIFKKWYKECLTTYISVFIRLIAINFAVFMMTLIQSEFHDVFASKGPLMTVLIIIGCLMFAKQVPKLIENITGLKSEGFTLNPIKKFQEQALFGKQITGLGAAGLAGGAAFGANSLARFPSALASFKNDGFKAGLKNTFYGFGSAAAGAGSAFARGTLGAMKGEKFGQIYNKAYSGAMTARTNRDDRHDLDISASEVWGENIRKSLHIANDSQKYESELKHLDEYVTAGTSAKQRAEGEIDKKADMIKYGGRTLGAMRDYYEQLKNGGPNMSDSIASIRNQVKSANAQNTNETDQQYEARIDSLMQNQQQAIDTHYQDALKRHSEATAKAHADYFAARKAVTNAYISNAENLNHATINAVKADGSAITDANGNQIVIEGFSAAFGSAPKDTIVVSNMTKMKNLNDEHKMNQEVNNLDIGGSIQKADDRRNEIRGSKEYGKSQLIQQQAAKEKK